jgi:hypothetical protein
MDVDPQKQQQQQQQYCPQQQPPKPAESLRLLLSL